MLTYTGIGLKYHTIADRGSLDQERVHLEVVKDCDSSWYLLVASVVSAPNRVAAGGRPAYWFESHELKPGDNVIIYTKPGSYSKALRPDGHFNHFFYWNMNGSLFGGPSACVIVAELNYWQAGF